VRFSELSNWIAATGIDTQIVGKDRGETGVDIRYRVPNSISFPLAGKPLTIGFSFVTFSEPALGQLTLREKGAICVEKVGRLPEEEISREYEYPLKNFFTLATDKPNSVDEYVVYNEDLREPDARTPAAIHVIGQPVYVAGEEPRCRLAHEMLFTYEDVKDLLPDMLNRWIDFSKRFRPFCEVYFGSMYSPSGYVEQRFLSLIQAMTLYFGEAKSGDETLGKALRTARASLIEPFSGKRRAWLADAMPVEAQVNLPSNLLTSLQDHRDLVTPLVGRDYEGFVDRVMATKSYYTRYDPALQARALHGGHLHWTTEKLGVLLKACILGRLGVPRDQAVKLFTRNRKYSHLKNVT